ncbi:hypothetical protein [Bartonella sp. DGB2]|uniref:hypothetical protein n=1 Tax=Bartonella sp. DGB2 TaxID=3388426 RepID=UPI00398FCEA0
MQHAVSAPILFTQLADQTMMKYQERQSGVLLRQLRYSASEQEAIETDAALRRLWRQSGSATVDYLMQGVDKALAEKNEAAALDLLDAVIVLKPDYGMAWVARAKIHIRRNDLKFAMMDLYQAIRYDLRRYDAWALLGDIMSITGRDLLAMKAYRTVLDAYPRFRPAQKIVGAFLEKEAGVVS